MATYPIKMLKDEEGKPFVPLVNFDAIKDQGGESLMDTINNKLEPANLIAGNQIELEVNGKNVIINNSSKGSTLINNLNTTTAGQGALDAAQGKVLKDSIPEIVNNLTTIDSKKALSAHQGYVLAGRSVPVGGGTGQVLMKSADDDYSLTWGDAADPNAIVGNGSIKKIVELTYDEYITLEEAGQLEDTTEYHINDWTDQSNIIDLSNRIDAVEDRLENKDIVDEGQNTRLDAAEGNIDTIAGTVNTLSTGLGKTLKMIYSGSSGGSNAYKDTGLSVEGGYGGGAYLVVMTWHLSSGDPTGTTVDIISLPYSGINFKQYRICELRNNEGYSKHLTYQASANKTLEFSAGGSGDAHIHIYKL